MRHIVLAFGWVLAGAILALAGAGGMYVFAGDADDGPNRSQWHVNDRLRALEMEVSVLQAREFALSEYIMANAQRADALDALIAKCTQEGFLSNKHSTRSRVTFFNGLKALAQSLRTGLPVSSEDEQATASNIEQFLGAAAKRARRKPSANPQPVVPPPPPVVEDDENKEEEDEDEDEDDGK